MGKAVKTILIGAAIIGAAFITGGLSLAPSTGLLGVTVVSSGLIASAALSLGAGLILSGVMGAISGSQKPPKIALTQLDRLNASLDPTAARKMVLGTTAFATDIRYVEPSGTNQEYIDYIIVCASHRVTSYDSIYFEDALAWLPGAGAQGIYAGYLWIDTILEGGPSNYIVVNGGALWGASQTLTGCAYIRVRIKRSGNSQNAQSPFYGGLPSRMTIIGKGMPLYDPALDSTVPGGSGAMRADNQSTWAFAGPGGEDLGNNTVLQALAYLHGWRINGRLAVGRGIPSKRLNLPGLAVSANMAFEAVGLSSGGSQPRYLSAGVISEADDPPTVLQTFATACNGRFREEGGKLNLVLMHNDLALAATDPGLTDDDVMGPFTWNPAPSLDLTPNVIRGRYTDPSTSALFQLVDYPEVRVGGPNGQSPDGIDRVLTLDLPWVQDAARAQRIAKQVLERKQYQRSFSAPFGERAAAYAVGQLVPFTFSALGFNRQLFRVDQAPVSFDGIYAMSLVIEDPALYQWDRDDSAGVSPAAPVRYNPLNNPILLGIDQAGRTAEWPRVTDPNGTRPANNATVGAPTGTNVAGTLAENIVSSIQAAQASIGSLQSAVQMLVDQVNGQVGGDISKVRNDLDAEIARALGQEGTLRSSVILAQSTASGAASDIASEKIIRADADGALSVRIDNIGSSAGGNSSAIQTEAATRASEDAALSLRVDTLVSVSSSSINPNSTFDIWALPGSPPSGWNWWDAAAGIRRETPGQNGHLYAAAFDVPENVNAGIMSNILSSAFGAYIVTVTGRATDWLGAACHVQFGNNGLATIPESVTINLAADQDTSGYASRDGGGGAYRRTWSKFYKTNVNGGLTQARIFAMANWEGVGARAAKSISFDQVSFRPATAAEIAAQRADTNATTALAQISSEQATRTSETAALAQTQNTLIAQLANAQGSGLSSRIEDVNYAAVTSTGAVASRTSSLEAMAGSMSASITTAQGAIASLQNRTGVFWQVTGIANGNRAQISLFADANGGGGVDIVGNLTVSGDVIVAGTVRTLALAANSVSNGDFAVNNSSYGGQGYVSVSTTGYSVPEGQYYNSADQAYEDYPGWQTILAAGYNIDYNARFEAIANFKQSHNNGNGPWAVRLLIDGAVVDDGWGQAPCDKVGLMGAQPVAAGYRVVVLQWQGAGNVTAVRPRIKSSWTYK